MICAASMIVDWSKGYVRNAVLSMGWVMSDFAFFGFITLWVILFAGTPDIVDGITHFLMNHCGA